MADRRRIEKILIPAAHWPTALLLIGYGVYWLELSVFPSRTGVTTPCAWLLWTVYAAMCLSGINGRAMGKNVPSWWVGLTLPVRILTAAAAVGMLGILAVAGAASIYPPHLPQEFDVISYHATIPRQHLIRGSWAVIPFLSADLFLLPLDFAVAPLTLVNDLMNKFPQFIVLLGLTAVAARLAVRLAAPDNGRMEIGFWTAAAVLGSHGLGVQMGTGMFDLVMAYLFVAAVDSWLDGRPVLAALEAALYMWSKAFVPLQTVVLVVAVVLLVVMANWAGVRQLAAGFHGALRTDGHPRKAGVVFWAVWLMAGMILAGPFLVKSWRHSGTPLFPFTPQLIASSVRHSPDEEHAYRQELARAAAGYINTRDVYGRGPGPREFLTHFWRIAVPENGVNNAYDYPLGLPYLLLAGPAVVVLIRSLGRRTFPLLPVFAVLFWMSWWFGSQQSRFLYVPLLILIVTVIPALRLTPVLRTMLCFAVLVNLLSVFRAHRADFFQPALSVLRSKDREILAMNPRHTGAVSEVVLPEHEAAFARFPFRVERENLPWVIAIGSAGRGVKDGAAEGIPDPFR